MVFNLSDEWKNTSDETLISLKENKNPRNTIHIPNRSRRGEYSKPHIQLNNCYGDPLDFSSSRWRQQFEDIQKCYSENYTGHIPLGKRGDSFFQSYVVENK